MKKHIPNALTCGNLLSGCIGTVYCFNGDLIMGAYCIGLGAFFDFFDGFAARLLKVSSPIGKELDSLADMVTFGVLPGVILHKLIYNGPADGPLFLVSLVAMAIPVFSALRLAKFNVDTRQTDRFIGVPTPANALFFASLPFIRQSSGTWVEPFFQLPNLLIVGLMMSFLLVAPLPLLALKFKSFGWKGNESRFLLIGLSVVTIVSLQWLAVPIILLLYVLLSLADHFMAKPKSNVAE